MYKNFRDRITLLVYLVILSLALNGCGKGEVRPDPVPSQDKATESATVNSETVVTDDSLFVPELPVFDIQYESFVLDNGLTVVVHEDHKVPIVAVNIWYHVGSKNEVAGRTGFAHLFEHLMFQGSENYKGEYFEPFEKVGATNINGTTGVDRTNYFQNVPTPALDMALWMESDRMGHFKGAITQELLDEQRGVVQNEKRQMLNQPYGQVWELIPEYAFPKGHPYSHSVIGSMEDLDAATLDDVQNWFSTWYGPSNAVLVLAGDITVQEAREKVETYFGDIPPGEALERPHTWISPIKEPIKLAVSDEVAQARLYRIYNVPEWGNPQEQLMEVIKNVLANGKNSRLYKRLVYEDQLATDVSVELYPGEISSQLWVIVTVRPGVTFADMDKVLNEEFDKLIKTGVSEAELQRSKMQFFSQLVYGSERIGGFGGKSDILAKSQVYGGSPDAFKSGLEVVGNATKTDVDQAITTWLSDGYFNLEIHPTESFDKTTMPTTTEKRNLTHEVGGPETPPMKKDTLPDNLTAKGEGVDRSTLPAIGTPPGLELPPLQRATLSNGLQVVLAERHEAPVVRLQMLVRAGFAADQFSVPGMANLALQMMDEGTETADAMTISGKLEDLGASLSTWSRIDMSNVALSCLTSTLEPSLQLFTDHLFQPRNLSDCASRLLLRFSRKNLFRYIQLYVFSDRLCLVRIMLMVCL